MKYSYSKILLALYFNIHIACDGVDGSIGEFVYLGIEETLKSKIDLTLHGSEMIELIINIDGLEAFESSYIQIWPILADIYHPKNIYEPFPVAFYAGT